MDVCVTMCVCSVVYVYVDDVSISIYLSIGKTLERPSSASLCLCCAPDARGFGRAVLVEQTSSDLGPLAADQRALAPRVGPDTPTCRGVMSGDVGESPDIPRHPDTPTYVGVSTRHVGWSPGPRGAGGRREVAVLDGAR